MEAVLATKIRFARRGRTHRPSYRLVAADSRSPRDGKFLEDLGFYDPNESPAKVSLKADAIIAWLETGAQPSDTALSLIKSEGIYAKFLAKKAGEDVSNFEIVKSPAKVKKAKLGEKAKKRIAAEKAAAEKAIADKLAAEEAAKAAAAAPAEEATAEAAE
jgi:small subunit ribosomal protein S16